MGLIPLSLSLRLALGFGTALPVILIGEMPLKLGNPLIALPDLVFKVLPLEFGPLRAGQLLRSALFQYLAQISGLFVLFREMLFIVRWRFIAGCS